MSEVSFSKFGSRGSGPRMAEISTSGDYVNTSGAMKLTAFVDVDTGATDSVTIESSPDGSTWYTEVSAMSSDGTVSLKPAPYYRATFSANSKVTIYGGR